MNKRLNYPFIKNKNKLVFFINLILQQVRCRQFSATVTSNVTW